MKLALTYLLMVLPAISMTAKQRSFQTMVDRLVCSIGNSSVVSCTIMNNVEKNRAFIKALQKNTQKIDVELNTNILEHEDIK
jgi:hypothetical protein